MTAQLRLLTKEKKKTHNCRSGGCFQLPSGNTRHPDIQAKAATDRNLTETPSHLLSSLPGSTVSFHSHSFIHPFPFRSSPTPPSRTPKVSDPRFRNLPDLQLQASPSSYETITNQVSSRGERGNLLGRFAACFATTSWCHGGGAALRARLICSWKGVHRFLLVSWTNRSRGELRSLLALESAGDSFVCFHPCSSERVFVLCLIWFRFCSALILLLGRKKMPFFHRFCLDW
jgi:hypothetical protein